ncbi:MAG TPA: Ppx/GppA phosphatase family protein [Conexibacter sp.]|jgi:exopolyphosphatase/guanosine-5'-triphosphate,3'-diphosphate pyrophosphatase
MRVGVVDIGTNSTRLLIADASADGQLTELDRRTQVTRLGDGVDASGSLAQPAMERVFATLDRYREALDAADVPAEARLAVLTSAVRDAANGADFTAQVRDRYGLDARAIPGEREAQLTFLGATHDRDRDDRTRLLVFDIGGGSTELVVGHADAVDFHVSTQAGVVRQTERHIRHDPPRSEELDEIASEIRAIIDAAVPAEIRSRAGAAIGVAGTATSLAAIDLALEPYDPVRVQGHVVSLATAERTLTRLAALDLAARQKVPGLHPDRAPTIVAGMVILVEVLRAFGLQATEVSEHDILHGVVLDCVSGRTRRKA